MKWWASSFPSLHGLISIATLPHEIPTHKWNFWSICPRFDWFLDQESISWRWSWIWSQKTSMHYLAVFLYCTEQCPRFPARTVVRQHFLTFDSRSALWNTPLVQKLIEAKADTSKTSFGRYICFHFHFIHFSSTRCFNAHDFIVVYCSCFSGNQRFLSLLG